ncbi:MAG: S8 family serine peptidase [Chloroflexota bacterium]|nr:S8 family serine peptidase [Chloroflexota bacterium]
MSTRTRKHRSSQLLVWLVLFSLLASLVAPLGAGAASTPAQAPQQGPDSAVTNLPAPGDLDPQLVQEMLDAGVPAEDIDRQLADEWPAHLEALAAKNQRRTFARPPESGETDNPETQRTPDERAVPAHSQQDPLWDRIEAAHSARDWQAFADIVEEIPLIRLFQVARFARATLPPPERSQIVSQGPVSAELELQQAIEDEARRSDLIQQEAASRLLALVSQPAVEESNTPAGDPDYRGPQAVRTVGDSCTYSTLQSAVDAANSGDIIRVEGRTYTGSAATVNINSKSLTIKGGYDSTCTTQGTSATVLDGTGQGDSIFEIYGGTPGSVSVIIDLFQITGGETDSNHGGGIELSDGHQVELQRTTVSENTSDQGGGVFMEPDTTLILDDQSGLLKNTSTGDGGGVYCSDSSIEVRGDSFIGFWLFASFGNDADGNGGGLYLDNCDLLLDGNSGASMAGVIDNSASNGGGVYAINASRIDLRGGKARVAGNRATTYGGGLYLASGSDVWVDNGAINENTSGSSGGGVYGTGSGTTVDLDSSDAYFCGEARCAQLNDNTSTSAHGGGAFVAAGAKLDLESVYVEGNQAGSLGSGIYGRGDGTRVLVDSAMLTGGHAGSDYAFRLHNFAGGAPTAWVRSSTVAGNSGHSEGAFGINTSARLDADALVVWDNTGSALVAGPGDTTIDCSILQVDFPGNKNEVQDPQFLDPANGNYHIRRDSPAVDHCDSGFSRDIDYEVRPYDVPGVTNVLPTGAEFDPDELTARLSHSVRIDRSELAKLAQVDLSDGLLRSVVYPAYLWLDLDQAAFDRLAGSDVAFDQVENMAVISFDRFSFDPVRDGEPVSSTDLLHGSARNPEGEGLFLVQLRAPATEQDIDWLQATGVILQYFPFNAFLLWSSPRDLHRALEWPNVRWTGEFHTAYRITGRLNEARSLAGDETLPFLQALFYDDGRLAEVEQAIASWGGEIFTRAPRHVMGEQGQMAVLEFSLAADRVIDLARLAQTIVVDLQFPSEIDDERSNQIIADNAPGGEPETGYADWLDATGYRGREVTVAVVDTGVDWDHPDLNVVSGTDYGGYSEPGEPGSDGAPDLNHNGRGSGHGTHVAGIVAGDGGSATADGDGFVYGLGIAPGATLHAQDAIAEDRPADVSIYQRVYDSADNADLSNNSWTIGNYGAGYTLNAANLDDYVLDAIDDNGNVRDLFLTVFSAGNSGDDCPGPCMSSITEPKEAKNLIVTGNSLSRRSDMAGGLTGDIDSLRSSSSRGPAIDGRLLPNIMAPGAYIISTENRVVTAGGQIDITCATSPGNSTQHSYCSGTSMSSPAMAGAAALFTEFWRLRNDTSINPMPSMVKAALVNTTDDLAGGDDGWGNVMGSRPDDHQGWGRANLDRMLNPEVAVQYYQNPDLLTASGQSWSREIEVNDTGQPLRITLVWSDAPGAAGANPARVNDLDLRVVAPNGTTWYGNRFGSNGWSATGAVDDDLNNVENVWIQAPLTGVYTVRVEAEFINGDAYYFNGDPTDQHFSLVCYNCEERISGDYDAGADEAYAFVGLNGALCQYNTITGAIAAASPGDTIYIAPGTYPEVLGTIDTDLTLTAATGDCLSDSTGGVTIDANDVDRVAYVAPNTDVTLANLRLTDGTNPLGGILYVDSGSTVILDNTDLTYGSASNKGGGLRVYTTGTVELINGSKIEQNVTTGSGDGSGVALQDATLIMRNDSRVGDYLDPNESADLGGGVYMDGGELQMHDTSRIRSNVAANDGGGVYAFDGADVSLYDSADIGYVFETANNDAVNGGGIFLTDPGTTLAMYGVSGVQHNFASYRGGGIYVAGGASVTISSSLVADNEATDRGGGIFVEGESPPVEGDGNAPAAGPTVTIQNGSHIDNNLTGDLGGGIYILDDNADVSVDDSSVDNNVASGYFGAIRLWGQSTLTIHSGASLSYNWANGVSGGGLGIGKGSANLNNAVLQYNQAAHMGGAISQTGGELVILDSDIRWNEAGSHGGGIYNLDGTLRVEAVNQPGYVGVNQAGGNGGGIYYDNSNTLELRALSDYRLQINSNTAQANGGGIFASGGGLVDSWGWLQMGSNQADNHGGGIYLDGGATLWLDDENNTRIPEIWTNTALTGNGGGIYALDSASVRVEGAQIGGAVNGNEAPAGDGGGIYLDDSDLFMANTLVRNNQAGDNGGGIAAENGSGIQISSTMPAPVEAPPASPTNRVLVPVICDPSALPADHYCTEFRTNDAGDKGGAIHMEGESTGLVSHAAFLGNTASQASAVELYDSILALENSLIRDNVASGINDSTVHLYDVGGVGPSAELHALHNTFADNISHAVYFAAGTSGTFDNNIVWNNGSFGIITPLATAACNDTQGGALTGPGNISEDPLFTATPRGDYRLGVGSPAIDACPGGDSPDLDNVARPAGSDYDMGAFEVACIAGMTDVNGSGSVDIVDIQLVAGDFNNPAYTMAHDVDCDGDVDVNDIQIVASDWTP